MLRILQQFILATLFAVFASQASAMFIQPDWFDPTQPGVGTNRYAYSFNDPINSWDPNGNACGGACSAEDQARIDETEPLPLFDETAGSIDAEIERLQNEIAGLPDNQAPKTGCNSARDCGATPGQSPITQRDLLMLELNALVGLRSVVPADTTEAGLMGIGLGMGRVGVALRTTGTAVRSAPDISNIVPSGWLGQANRKGVGTRWSDPNNAGNAVRVDLGNPNHSLPSQSADHVIVRSNGQVIGRNGAPIQGSIRDNAVQAHIPLSEYRGWSTWNSP